MLLSVKPQYANTLVNGCKKVELRRKFPVGIAPGTKIYIYSSSPDKKIIGEVSVGEVKKLKLNELWKDVALKSLVPWDDFKRYFDGCEYGYAVHVVSPVKYESPVCIKDLGFESDRPPQSYRYVPKSLAF